MTDDTLVPLERKPDTPLTGVKRHPRMPDDIVGDWFVGRDGEVYLRAYHHERNVTKWFHVRRAVPRGVPEP